MVSIKRILTIIFIFILLFTISSCVSYEEIKPNDDDYAVWDNNYIYYGNKRCKTTGEGEEVLIKQIDYEDNRYFIVDTLDYCYNDNNIYFIFSANTVKDLSEYNSTLFVKYIIKTKSYEVLGVGDKTSYHSIVKNYEDYLYVKVNSEPSASDYLIYDINNGNTSILPDITKITFLNDYVIIHNYGLVKYSIYNQLDFVTIGQANIENQYNYLEYNNKDYITITTKYYDKDFNESCVYYLYDVDKNELHTIISEDEKIQFQILNEEYFIIYQDKDFGYLHGNGCAKKENVSYHLRVENKLCKFNYDEMKYELVYEFGKNNYDYTNGFILDGSYYVKSSYVKRGWFIFKGDIKSKNYQLTLDNYGIRKIKTLPDTPKVELIDRYTITYNNYEYYIKNVSYGGMLANLHAEYLYCYNKDTKETNLMQFFTEAAKEDGRYAESLFTDNIVFDIDNILILGY